MLPHVLFVVSFFENLERLSQPDYIPTHEDILHARQSTQGVEEKKISVNNFQYRYLYSAYTYFTRDYESNKFKCMLERKLLVVEFSDKGSFRAGIHTGLHRFTEIGQIFHNKYIFDKEKLSTARLHPRIMELAISILSE